MSSLGALALVLLTGCGAIFGIHTVEPAIDAPPIEVTVRTGYTIIEPDGAGGYLPPRDQVFAQVLDVALDDGTVPTLVTHADGSLTFARTRDDQGYRLRYTRVEADTPITYVGAVADLELFDVMFGRYDRTPVPQNTFVNVAFPVMTETAYVMSTGIRTVRGINNAPNSLSSVTIDWTTPGVQSGTSGLLDSAKHDTLYFVEYAPMGAYLTIDKIASAAVTSIPGGTAFATMTPMPAGSPGCVRLTAQRAEEVNRLALALPSVTSLSSLWGIDATPFPATSPLAGLLLAVRATPASIGEPEIDVSYHQPFPGEVPVLGLLAGATQLLDGLTVTSTTEHFQLMPLTVTCDASSATTIAGTISLPTDLQIDGQPATGDVTPTARHVTWQPGPGIADFYTVEIDELAGTVRAIARYITTATSVDLDAGVLLQNHAYTIHLITHAGVPSARTGAFRPIQFPYGRTSIYSPAIHIR